LALFREVHSDHVRDVAREINPVCWAGIVGQVFGHIWAGKCDPFIFNGRAVDREEEYRYLGFIFHAIKGLAHGTAFMVAAAKKATHAMRRRCVALHL